MTLMAGNLALNARTHTGDKCVARTFWDCDHGWAAARGDWSNPRINAASLEV